MICPFKYLSSMVFCVQNCSSLLWGNFFSGDQEELLKFKAEGREFANVFTRTIHSNNERSDQSLKQNVFLTYYRRFLISNMYIRTIIIQIVKNDWGFINMQEKLEMVFCYQNCSDLLWEKIVLVSDQEKLLQNFWDH